MPVISKFYGIIVRLMRLPNRRPAIYANYGEHEVVMDASTLQIISGNAPERKPAWVARATGQSSFSTVDSRIFQFLSHRATSSWRPAGDRIEV